MYTENYLTSITKRRSTQSTCFTHRTKNHVW